MIIEVINVDKGNKSKVLRNVHNMALSATSGSVIEQRIGKYGN